MALCQLRNPNALFASRELQPTWPVARLAEERLRWNAQRGPSCRALPLECSAKKSRGSGKPKTTKSNDDLCNELRQFVSAMGLPEDHVPSTKELFEHGRTKLAYVVRRRGHKEITNLLRNQTTEGTTTENDVGNDDHFGNVSTKESIDALQTQDMPDTDADNVDTQLLSPLPRQQYSSMFNGASAVQFLDELQLSSRNMSVEEILGNSDLGGGMESDQNSVFGQSNTSHLAEEEANQAELNQLKELLRQKESELAQLKQQIEEEKFALSTMQNKAQTEISKVQNILFKTDNELQAAEESLSGLKEVLIEYCGNGETVEVAGSFNGWQHRVKMDSHASSNSNGARESILWSTILWLYPGIYEFEMDLADPSSHPILLRYS